MLLDVLLISRHHRRFAHVLKFVSGMFQRRYGEVTHAMRGVGMGIVTKAIFSTFALAHNVSR